MNVRTKQAVVVVMMSLLKKSKKIGTATPQNFFSRLRNLISVLTSE